MATIWCNRKELYTAPPSLVEKQQYFRDNPPTKWLGNEIYESAFEQIYGVPALENAKSFWSVPENVESAFVQAPKYGIEVKSAEPGAFPSGTAPEFLVLARKIDQAVKQILDAIGTSL